MATHAMSHCIQTPVGSSGRQGGNMFGAAVIIVLAGMLIPISLLVAAIVFDAALVAWLVFQEWHDHRSPRLSAH